MTAVGIDLCSDYTAVHINGTEQALILPTVICRDREAEHFSIGEEAYRKTLAGSGVLVDKLTRLAERRGTATIGGQRYEAGQLLSIFLRKAVKAALPAGTEFGSISSLSIALPKLSEEAISSAAAAALSLGIPKKAVRIISHTEAMMYYVLNGDKEFYSSTVALFNLSEDKLYYYEMKVLRGLQRQSAAGDGEPMDESFSLDILKNEAGRKLGDSILLNCAEKLMARKNYSAVFLTGKGFDDVDYFPQFREFICRRRRVCLETGLFALGASEEAADRLREETHFPYVFLCESRLSADISMNVVTKNREERLLLAAAGSPWNETNGHIEVIPCRQNYIDIEIAPLDRVKKHRTVRIPLSSFPERPDRCTRVALSLSFPRADRMRVSLHDRGLGEIFPGTDASVCEEIDI